MARLRATRELIDATGIEFTSLDHVYAWEKLSVPEGVPLHTFCSEEDKDSVRIGQVYEKALSYLSELRPDAIAIPGWDTGFSLVILRAAHVLRIPAILMSESQRVDFSRWRAKEWIKRGLVRLYSSAIVGGQPHIEYAHELGMKTEAIFRCMDVVDNDHFASALSLRRKEPPGRQRTFLVSARFIEKKNLIGMLRAYKLYRDEAGEGAWKLTIQGDGPLKRRILDAIRKMRLDDHVFLPGFVQYPELPAQLAKASVFILPSTSEQWGLVVNEAMAAGLPVLVSDRAGCARDLVASGVNGFTFNPFDCQELSALMLRIASDEQGLQRMGRASTEIIAKWGVDNFANQLMLAAQYALNHPASRASGLQLRALDILARAI